MMSNNSDFSELSDVNRMIHEPSRTAILSLLSVVEEADFLFVMNNTGLTQGNLSSHLSKLEEAGLVKIVKTFKGKRPHTIISITESGNSEFKKYIGTMKSFLGRF